MNEKATSNVVKELVSLINKVRSDSGCPFLRQQTFKKQFKEVKGEVKELEDAIINHDINNLKEELGDVFWDILLLIETSEKEYGFKIEDILEKTRQKIIRRKPYVFGDEKAKTPEEALAIWKKVKEQEGKT